MVQANVKQKNLIIDILVAAFKDNQSVNFIVRQDNRRLRRIAALMDYSFEMCNHFGDVWITEQKDGCALMLYPHLKKFSLFAIWLDLKLIFQAIGISGIFKALKREGLIKKIQPKEPMAYLWFIGIEPSAQKAGRGSELLKEVIDSATSSGLPTFLETSTPANLPWYKKFSFEIYDRLDLGYTLYFLKRTIDKH
ncbi:GNAT family N-acetyltransferase [Mucilaginibacter sp. KACC 22773]|uniref:GNAT family N-acetyltransferase n=1 Tax=Mucilaginibacter sp. KACC 22773 TaxID=3025671 RepID=UPI002366B9EF|nr:GNAT family N-acetyltransferase [Mucilaginibacter sp. KACC 22773]WDF77068.1 GNAT family N-acetyltransferase [Mucilaginibacter sp. KACC 22773]